DARALLDRAELELLVALDHLDERVGVENSVARDLQGVLGRGGARDCAFVRRGVICLLHEADDGDVAGRGGGAASSGGSTPGGVERGGGAGSGRASPARAAAGTAVVVFCGWRGWTGGRIRAGRRVRQ